MGNTWVGRKLIRSIGQHALEKSEPMDQRLELVVRRCVARQHKGRVQGLRPEGAKELSPGFQPWVPATQKCALKVARA
jgi:hypothetical protein